MNSEKTAYATLKIASTVRAVPDISSVLGLIPSESLEKGKTYGKRSPRAMEESVWFLKSKTSKHEPIEKHIEELLDLISDKRGQLEDLSRECDISIVCFYSSSNGQGGIYLSNDVLNKIAALPVDLVFDLYLSESDS